MRIEGVIATTAMAAQQAPALADAATQQERTQVAQVPQQAAQVARHPAGEIAPAVGSQVLDQAVQQVDKLMASFNDEVTFKVHKETKSTIVTVVNKQTGEVIRQFPSEKFLDLVAMFQKQLSGLFVDDQR